MNTRRAPAPVRLLLVSVVAMLAAGCGSPDPKPAAPAPARSVRVARPERGEITRSVVLPATVRPFQEATLYAKVSGYLKTIAVDKGDAVAAGAVLATLEIPELDADLARDLAQLGEAERDSRRQGEARAQAPNLVVPKTVDEARTKAAVARANVERVRTLLGYATISAPFPGVVTRRWADPGAFIPAATASSTPQNSAVVTLTDFSRVRVQVPVPESEARFVARGTPASFTVEGLPGRELRGEVTRSAQVLDDATRTMMVEVEVDNADGALRPGMEASMRLVVERKADALLLPAGALLWEKAKASVFTVVDGRSHKLPVKTGFADASRVEILEGTDAATPVILLASQPMADNQAVLVTEAP